MRYTHTLLIVPEPVCVSVYTLHTYPFICVRLSESVYNWALHSCSMFMTSSVLPSVCLRQWCVCVCVCVCVCT